MSELVPCPGCRRHVVVDERACPFCARALPALRPQRVSLTGRVSRAAVFAAVAACSKSDKPNPPPAAHGSGSDDLEKLLDYEPRAAEHPDAVAKDAAIAIDAPALADAGVDAALPDAGVKKKKKRVQQQQQINDQLVAPPPPPWDPNNIPKPYGAPPARKRIV
jgi:hypothetical protein